MSEKNLTFEICPFCKKLGPHKRSCPLNPFNRSKKKFDLDEIYEIEGLDQTKKLKRVRAKSLES